MKPPKAILFDAGNTLVWLDHPYLVTLLAEHGVHTTVEALMTAEAEAKLVLGEMMRAGQAANDGSAAETLFREMFRRVGAADEQFPALSAALWARHAESHLWKNVREHTAETLEELRRRGYRLGVISNADGRVDGLLQSVGLAAPFEFIMDSRQVGLEKPDPRIFRLGAEKMGLDPSEVAYVGDIYEIDVQGSRAAGMRPILIDPLWRWNAADCERIRGIHDLLALMPEAA
ncbi:HAD family hydrolase [Longimicrobium terrae]|uniref:HAD superfamily hydrolase (TIGR01549 family) n=1 Tax=Longimicrobium terrae TaxID=1639882 RepID=A0A841GWP6_9BACT|nr:HAD-IA family hydrolase [Longimicrobium terrae]MBB4635271.1 HAD superfamily hydrolase (TIGR01549 family) [Longimicrobium terrae]MBB6069665.1 HAD superfamily hydrolase (TIGR01549 family) [Longimicrobium terrae]NNC31124.1 HAD-IA family hydrolase [Longimicrobium terrae]